MKTNKNKQLDGNIKMQQNFLIPPIVGSWNSKNSSLTNLTTKHDFPTAESPNKTSLKWHTLFAAIIYNVLNFFLYWKYVSG